MKPIGQVLADMGWPERLRDLAYRVERNMPHPHNPGRFHEERSEIADDLRGMAMEARHGTAQEPR